MKSYAWAAVAFALTLSCTKTVPPPQTSLGSALATVRSAWNAGAKNDPEAAERLQRASAGIDRAITLQHEGKNEEAQQLLTRANADAELALSLARESMMQRHANEARAIVETARQEK